MRCFWGVGLLKVLRGEGCLLWMVYTALICCMDGCDGVWGCGLYFIFDIVLINRCDSSFI